MTDRQHDMLSGDGRPPAHLLATKLFVPPARANAVARPQLIQTIQSGVRTPEHFVLLAGPAGSGKTSLLSEFAAGLNQRVAWISLEEADDDPNRFWTYVVAACGSVQRQVGKSALALLASPQPLPDEAVPTQIINDLAYSDQPLVLVLDDFHQIQDRSIHAGLLYLLDHLPASLHIIISTRADPPWPLARFRARGQLTEIRAHELRFGVDEATEFLNGTMGLRLANDDIAALEQRTEGWIAGLQLAALSMRGVDDPSKFVESFSGSHVYIAEFLFDEIFRQQSEDTQLFLLKTSISDRMNAGLCEALTDCADGQAVLQDLHRSNIFMVPLDTEDNWFRYHHLFSDLLRNRLQRQMSSEQIVALHRCAAQWCEQHGWVHESVHHALAAEDFTKAASLLDRVGQDMVFTDQATALRKWLAALPSDVFRIHPRLELFRNLMDMTTGKRDMYETTLRETEMLVRSLPHSPENDRLRMQALVYLSMFYAHQNTARAKELAEEALTELPEYELKSRASAWSTLYRAYGMDGQIDESTQAYKECFRLAQAAGEYGMLGNTTMIRAFDLCQYGRLDEATHYCRSVIDAGERSHQQVFFPAGPCYIGLAGVHLERFELDSAEELLHKGMAVCRQGAPVGLYTGSVQTVRLLQAKGDLVGAWSRLGMLEQTFKRRDFTVTERQVSLRLAMEDVDGAARLAPSILALFGDSPYAQVMPLIAAEAFKLALARIFVAQGALEHAETVLDEIAVTAGPGKRHGRLMEVFLIRALAELKRQGGEPSSEAVAHLASALELAEQHGMVLLLLEAGPPLVPLLRAYVAGSAHTGSSATHALRLLKALGSHDILHTPYSSSASSVLVEPLTKREMEVLVLVAAGDSNQEIADQLVITVRTVKKHVTNILAKLGATNRTQAVARAREIDLLSAA